MSAFLVLGAIIVLAIILAVWYPDATLVWTRRIVFARKVLFTAAALLVAFILIGTGLWYLILIGGFTFLVAVWIGYFQFYEGVEVS